MSQELRHRGNTSAATTAATTTTMNHPIDEGLVLGRGLSASNMIEASPSQHGVALKLHIPLLFGILPTSFKKLVMTWSCFAWLMPQWRQRYLILIGNYLYKFKGPSSSTPKGTPFSVALVEADLQPLNQQDNHDDHDDDMAPAFANLPPGYDAVFIVSTFGKQHYCAVSNREEALSWVNSLRQSRQAAITRSLGHAGNMPYPKSWEYFDSLGRTFEKSKERIKRKLEDQNLKELELSGITGGGSLPRGFYG
jgi:hypothetical protein